MRKQTFVRALRAPAVMAAVLTGGCALPIGVQVAFFAVDGISLAVTEKTVAGHGLSAASGQDCALHRIITSDDGEGICRSADTALAEASAAGGPAGPAPSDPAADYEHIAAQAEAELPERPAAATQTAAAPETLAPETAAPGAGVQTETTSAAVADAADAAPGDDAGVKLHEAAIDEGRYIVIGTYRSMPNAERLALKHRAFEPRVLMTELRSGALYRVVVGPYEEGRRRVLARELAEAGMFDVWAMAVTDEARPPKVWAPAPQLQIAGNE